MGSENALQPVLTVLYTVGLIKLMKSIQAIHTQRLSPKVLKIQRDEGKPD